MSTAQFLLTAWKWDWLALAAGLGICLLRWATLRLAAGAPGEGPSLWRTSAGRNLAFGGALLALVVALCSPVRVLADSYLFSAHMLQHLLLLLVVPPLLLASLPPRRASKTSRGDPGAAPPPSRGAALRWARLAQGLWRYSRLTTGVSWLAGVGAMWLWHARTLCDAATSSPAVFQLQLGSLLLCGILFWLPIYGPQTAHRLAPLSGIAYLFSACLACSLLGIYITFTPLSVCSIYVHPADPLGVLPLIRQGWDLSPAADQRLGGLMMWVPACLVYLAGILSLLARWYGAEEPPPLPMPAGRSA